MVLVRLLEHLVIRRHNTIFLKMRQNAHFETTTTCKTSKIVVEGKEKHVLCNEHRETQSLDEYVVD